MLAAPSATGTSSAWTVPEAAGAVQVGGVGVEHLDVMGAETATAWPSCAWDLGWTLTFTVSVARARLRPGGDDDGDFVVVERDLRRRGRAHEIAAGLAGTSKVTGLGWQVSGSTKTFTVRVGADGAGRTRGRKTSTA